jgi:hypothetical protein
MPGTTPVVVGSVGHARYGSRDGIALMLKYRFPIPSTPLEFTRKSRVVAPQYSTSKGRMPLSKSSSMLGNNRCTPGSAQASTKGMSTGVSAVTL